MIITRYKPLFSVKASYTLADAGVSGEGLVVDVARETESKMRDFKLKPKATKNNRVTIFYEGLEKPNNLPTSSEPLVEIKTDQYFYFSLRFSENDKIKGLKFHSTTSIAKEVGFPLLYDAFVDDFDGPPVVSKREDVKVVGPVFTFVVKSASTGISADHATLKIKDEKNRLINPREAPVKRNDKEIEQGAADPEFAFSVDLSTFSAGIYELGVGNFKKKFFIANNIDISSSCSVIRVLKNNFLEYKKDLADKTFHRFELIIPRA